MQVIFIFSIIKAIDALQSNILLTFVNKTQAPKFTKITYRLNVNDETSDLFKIENHYLILMETFISANYWINYGSVLLFESREFPFKLTRRVLFNTSKENLYLQNHNNSQIERMFKYVLDFPTSDIVEKVYMCKFDGRKIFGLFAVINYYEDENKLEINGEIFPTRIDAFLNIFGKERKMFCEYNFKLILAIFGFLVAFCLGLVGTVLKIALKKLKKISSRVNVEYNT